MHIPEVVKKVKELGGTITNIMQLIPVKGSEFEDLPLVSNKEIMGMRKECGETMKQMYHCKQCRADAIGTLGEDISIEFNACHSNESGIIEPDLVPGKAFQVAVATKSGMLVDQHFGQVSDFFVYEYLDGLTVFKERRNIDKYCNGISECDNKEDKITSIINTIGDCDAVIAMRIGEAPKSQLLEKGIKVYTTYDRIEDSVKKVVKELL
jgi:predicted Fe-Mo cluster-binding NifX family protein